MEKRPSPESPAIDISLKKRLKTALAQESLQVDTPITPEQRTVLEQELKTMANLFESYGKPWFIAGGTALDLALGAWKRHHQDCDIAMSRSDIPGFFAHASARGYQFISTAGESIQNETDLAKQPHNVFFFHKDTLPEDRRHQELMFLETNEAGDILFSTHSTLVFPKELYTKSTGRYTDQGRDFPITPTEVQLLYKLFDGRQKDFLDIQRLLPTLDQDARKRLNTYIQQLNISFQAEEKITRNIDELICATRDSEAVLMDVAIHGYLSTVLPKRKEALRQRAQVLHGLYMNTRSPELYKEAVKSLIGASAYERNSQAIDRLSEGLFALQQPPTLEEFQRIAEEAFFVDTLLFQEALQAIPKHIPQQKRWTVVQNVSR